MGEAQALCDALEASLGAAGGEDWRAFLGEVSFEALRMSGLLVPSATRWRVACEACWEGHVAEVEEHDGGFRHYCPEAGWIAVDGRRLKTLTLDLGALFLLLNGGCERPGEMVAGRVWMLGDVALLRGRVTMVFARAIGETAAAEALAASLQKTTPADVGLVLTSSAIGLDGLVLPRGYKLCRLQDAVCVEGGRLARDDARLASWLGWRGREREAAKASQGGRTPAPRVEILSARNRLIDEGVADASTSNSALAGLIIEHWDRLGAGKTPGRSTIRKALAEAAARN